MKHFCNYCKEELSEGEDFCPNCNIPLDILQTKSDIFICPVCGSKNSLADNKCKYCCSIINKQIDY